MKVDEQMNSMDSAENTCILLLVVHFSREIFE